MAKKSDFIFVAPSKYKQKKYDAYTKDGEYITSFGAIKKNGTPYDQYKDKIGYYSMYDHKDKKRRDNYYKRHNKNYPKYSPDWFSKKFLW